MSLITEKKKNFRWTSLHVQLINIAIYGTQSDTDPSENHLKILIKNISLSIESLKREIKSVLFEMDQFEHRDFSIIKVFLPLLVNHDFNSDVEDKFHHIYKRINCLK